MGFRSLQTLILTFSMVASLSALAADNSQTTTTTTKAPTSKNKRVNVEKDLDTLGGNDALMEKAKAIDPENRTRIVQKRTVDRDWRLELGGTYGAVAQGDTYLNTQSFGASMDLHINPRWSVGARYYDFGNSLTAEGQRAFDQARAAWEAGGRSYTIPDIDYPMQEALGTVSWYPVYGKTNILDMAIAQFDVYTLAGAGQIQLSSGWTPVYTAGAGVGIWLSQHWSVRPEIRWQNYHDQIITGPRTINEIVGTIGIGFLL